LHRFRLPGRGEELALFSSVVTFTEARDATVADLSVEAFFPADDATRSALTRSPDRDGHPQGITRQVNAHA
jgi:hypothetical protein